MRQIALLLVLGIAACKQPPNFDERYKDASTRIEKQSASIENELKSREESEPAHPSGQHRDPPSD
ncbi:hypothetical protein [Croceicoccus sp. Ery15]|uniref:hypothetical protein n=1 Tax=Croceicoccus sp. Ery15 TaxID=1703338 RepID=UPI001E331F79|nr:hypothetical protein [Croceicoccus sp. Ery15]